MYNFPQLTLNGETSPPQMEVEGDAAVEWFDMKFVLVLLWFYTLGSNVVTFIGCKVKRKINTPIIHQENASKPHTYLSRCDFLPCICFSLRAKIQ